jgi:hypothetical protein
MYERLMQVDRLWPFRSELAHSPQEQEVVAQLGRSVAHMVERENVLRYMLVPRPACLLISSAETHHASITNQGRDRGQTQ